MGCPMTFSRAVTVPLEIAHFGLNGKMHGHSLLVEVWTTKETCLNAFRSEVTAKLAHIEGQLEVTINGRTFEELATAAMTAIPEATRIIIRLPTAGYWVEVCR